MVTDRKDGVGRRLPATVARRNWCRNSSPRAKHCAGGRPRRGKAGHVRSGGAATVAVTERGTFFGYGDLVVDMRNFARLKEACGCPVVFDGTHSVQQPGQGKAGASGGLRQHIPALLCAAAAAGADGFFVETHPDPDRAPSDGPNMIRLQDLSDVIARALDVWHAARGRRD
jgi:2-dehydro-3-deoxyphosphooctonate aldolase (KDO 8-P synthase)